MDFGNGFHRWNTIPTRWRSDDGGHRCAVDVLAIQLDGCRCARAPGMSAFSRLIDRRNVDLPQPDGPMSAVTARAESLCDVVQRLFGAVPEGEVLRLDGARVGTGDRGLGTAAETLLAAGSRPSPRSRFPCPETVIRTVR